MGHLSKIVQLALSYKGQEEIPPNLGFKDPDFAAKMRSVGFYRTASWCGFFVILVLFTVYSADAPLIMAYLRKYLSPSTHTMWLNLRASREITTGQIPKVGALVFWQEGDGTNGHVGIVIFVSLDGKTFHSMEGNTNGAGGREGFRVWENNHTVGLPHSEKGLNLMGFAYMPD